MAFYATRPETFADLDDHDRRPEEFLDLNLSLISRDTTVGAAALTLIEACRNSKHFDVSEDGEFKVTRPQTPEERDRSLRDAQRQFDYQTMTIDAVIAGEPIDSLMVWQVPYIAKARGLTNVPDPIVKQ